ncbi:MAG: hypothetical protein WAQ24_01670 [Candidatus Saccharimonadales bacterium]
MSAQKPLVLFVPGSGEDLHSRNYQSVLRAIEQQGYKTQFIPITWSRTTPSKWRAQLMEEYVKHDPYTTILAGFSFGAVTALLAATERKPAALWLFSLSPYFAENFASPHMKQSWLSFFGKRRIAEFRSLSFAKLAAKVQCPTLLFYGAEEFQKFPIMKRQSQMACSSIANARLHVVPHAGHDVTAKPYIQSIKATIANPSN